MDEDIVLFANDISMSSNNEYYEPFQYKSEIPSWLSELYWKIKDSAWLEKQKEEAKKYRAVIEKRKTRRTEAENARLALEAITKTKTEKSARLEKEARG